MKNSTGLRKVQAAPLHEQIYAEISDALIIGRFIPGDILSTRELAGELGTSPMPVRDALWRLVSDGALETTPTRKFRVPLLNVRKFTQLCSVRSMLEGEAAALAAINATPKMLSDIASLNERMTKASQDERALQSLKHNRAFHFAIYESADNGVLLQSIRLLWLQCGPYFLAMFSALTSNASPQSDPRPQATNSHLEIIEALKRRNPKDARRGILNDIKVTENTYLKLAEAEEKKETKGALLPRFGGVRLNSADGNT